MLHSMESRGDRISDGHTWTFIDDNRLVGELTKVVRTLASGTTLEGWATIAAYRSSMTKGAIPGMCIVGPVFSTVERSTVLDLHPTFCRLDRMIPSVETDRVLGQPSSASIAVARAEST